jgi:hypothetical protein
MSTRFLYRPRDRAAIPVPVAMVRPAFWLDARRTDLANNGAVASLSDRSNTITFEQASGGSQPAWLASVNSNRPGYSLDSDYLVYKGAPLTGYSGEVFLHFTAEATGTHTLLAQSYFFSQDRYIWFGVIEGKPSILQCNADTASSVSTDTALSAGYHSVLFRSNGTAYAIDVDGVATTLDVNAGSNNGDWFSDTEKCNRLVLGGLCKYDG